MDKPAFKNSKTLTRLAIRYLTSLLQSTGWTRGMDDVVVAGEFLVRKVPKDIENPMPDGLQTDAPKFREWASEPFQIAFTDKELDASRFAFEKFAKDAKLPPNRWSLDLGLVLGLGATLEQAKPTHKIPLSTVSARILVSLLQRSTMELPDNRGVLAHGWTKKGDDVLLAGLIMRDRLPAGVEDQAPADVLAKPDLLSKWEDKIIELELTEAQREACKACLEKYGSIGQVPTSKHGAALARAFGFGESVSGEPEGGSDSTDKPETSKSPTLPKKTPRKVAAAAATPDTPATAEPAPAPIGTD